MQSPSDVHTILVVVGDVTLGQVLSRVLSRPGFSIEYAGHAAQALELADRHSPSLVLLDYRLRGSSALELAKKLCRNHPGLRIIVMTDDPLCGQENGSPPKFLTAVLDKSFDLHELRQAVDDALLAAAVQETACLDDIRLNGAQSTSTKARRSGTVQFAFFAKEFPMRFFRSNYFRAAGIILIGLAVVASVAVAMGAVRVPWPAAGKEQKPAEAPKSALGVELAEEPPHTLVVPVEVRRTLGIRKGSTDQIVEVKKPTKTRPLVMPGSTGLDPTRLYRIRARFAPSPSSAEVIEIGKVAEDPKKTGKVQTVFREIRSGDPVAKGDLLAVFHSVDVGNQKNNLIDGLYQLKLDQEILKKAEARPEVVPEVFLLNARRNVQGDINAVNRAVSTLKTWGIPEQDIQAARDEAEQVIKRQGKHDPKMDALWARVEIRSPVDGVIIERNVSLHEIVVDNTTNLFQIAKVDKLIIFAYCPEDDLPLLDALPTDQRRWTVKTVGSDPIAGFIDDVSYLIDPNQHSAVVKGHINNPINPNTGQPVLRGTQFVTATVQQPPPEDAVEIPTSAIVDDGKQCAVFVQTDASKHHYTLRRVQVTHRFEKTAFVKSNLGDKEKILTSEEKEAGLLPFQPLTKGERILAAGVLELKKELDDRESKRQTEPGH